MGFACAAGVAGTANAAPASKATVKPAFANEHCPPGYVIDHFLFYGLNGPVYECRLRYI